MNNFGYTRASDVADAVRQVAALVEELPEYRTTIRHKIADVRGASSQGPVGKLQAAIDDIQTEIEGKPVRPPTPVVVGEPAGPLGVPAWVVRASVPPPAHDHVAARAVPRRPLRLRTIPAGAA